jgi:hypothetical protein
MDEYVHVAILLTESVKVADFDSHVDGRLCIPVNMEDALLYFYT